MHQAVQTDFKLLFESVPGLYLILSPDLTIVAVSDAYLKATMTKRIEILGKGLFEAFPNNPDDPTATGVSNLRASLNSVLQDKMPHTMAVQKYDIRRPDGTFEERFWSPLNKPVLDEKKEILWIIHRVEDVTEFIRLKKEELKQMELTKDLKRQVEEMEMETYKRAQEIQLSNKFLLQEVKERKRLEEEFQKFNVDLEKQVEQKTAELSAALGQLKESEGKYKTIFYKSPLPKWIYDLETLRFLEVNEMAVEHYGYSEKEFRNMTIKDVRPKEDLALLMEDIQKIRPAAVTRHGVWRHLKKNGEIIFVETTAHSIDYNGRMVRMVVINDITENIKAEKQIAAERTLLRSLIDNLPVFIYVKDLQSRYIIANKALTGLVGAESEKDVIGKTVLDLFGADIAPVNFEEDKRIFEGGELVIDREEAILTKTGAKMWLLTSKVPLRDENHKIIGLIGISRDITEIKNAEILLKQLVESLEQQSAELLISNKELEQFAYVASHDLQEPLRMVSSFLELLERKLEAHLDDTTKQYIHYAVDGSERMKKLIQDLLLYSRVGTNKESWEEVDCNEILNNVINIFELPIHEKKAILDVKKLPVINAVKTQVQQLFQNLIGNALKYSGDKIPRIEVGCNEKEKMWQLYIKDNGIGIDPRFFEKIFVIFQRLHNRSEYSGTGIGLAICKKIVERHKGKIWVESEPANGSSFFIEIPKSKK